jgi:hypothetical protein
LPSSINLHHYAATSGWLAMIPRLVGRGRWTSLIGFRSASTSDRSNSRSFRGIAFSRYYNRVHIPLKTSPLYLTTMVRIDSPPHHLPSKRDCLFFHPTGHYQLEELRLVELTVLRRLTLRMTFTQVSTFIPNTLQTALAITPPLFRKLVLEIDGLPCPSEHWGHWGGTDYFLERRFAKHGDFRLIVRTSVLDDPETFQEHVKGAFPLLTRRGCVHFVMSSSIGKSLPTP